MLITTNAVCIESFGDSVAFCNGVSCYSKASELTPPFANYPWKRSNKMHGWDSVLLLRTNEQWVQEISRAETVQSVKCIRLGKGFNFLKINSIGTGNVLSKHPTVFCPEKNIFLLSFRDLSETNLQRRCAFPFWWSDAVIKLKDSSSNFFTFAFQK